MEARIIASRGTGQIDLDCLGLLDLKGCLDCLGLLGSKDPMKVNWRYTQGWMPVEKG